MRKVLLACLIALIGRSTSWCYTFDIVKDVTITIGMPYSFTPVFDSSIPLNWYDDTSAATFDGLINNKTSTIGCFITDLSNSSIIDGTVLGFTSVSGTLTNWFGSTRIYYAYTLNPTVLGNYALTTAIGYHENGSGGYMYKKMKYNFTSVRLESVTIANNLSLPMGSTKAITATIAPSTATTNLTWSSSDPEVVSVDNGNLTALSVGTAVITCTAHNGVSAQCNVTVTPIQAESITMNTSSMEITEGERSQLNVSFTPENVTSKNLLWQSDNESVAIVDQTGRVTGIAAGTCNITATTQDGSNKVANCEVRVISDYIYCGKTIAVAGSNGTLAVSLKNSTELTAMQFELDLPDGVTVSEAALTSRKNGHSIDYALLGNGNYQFTVFSSSSKPFIGNDGVLINVVLSMPAEMEAGDYTLWQKNIELTTTAGHAVYIEDRSSTLTVNDALLGDVNGDTKISITDAVGIVNYILGNVSASFLPEAADVNGDGGISITDAVKIVNIILNQGSGVKEQRKQEMETEREPQ